MRHKKFKIRHKLPPADVNITSLMDILTTLLFFILLVTSIAKYSVLEGSADAEGGDSDKKEKFSLGISMSGKNRAVMKLGPIKGLKVIDKKILKRYLRKRFRGSDSKGYRRTITGRNSKDLSQKVQRILVEIKKGFPHEFQIKLLFGQKVSYQTVVDLMASVRTVDDVKKAFVLTNFLGKQEKSMVLFPEIIIAEI